MGTRPVLRAGLGGDAIKGPLARRRRGDWLKIKRVQAERFVIIGYEASTTAPGGIGRLLLAACQRNHLVYVGSVGTGFTQAGATALRKQMDELIILKPALCMKGCRQDYRWLTPALVAEVEFLAWTHDGKLQQASYKGLLVDADAAEVFALR
ncbi:ATP dependent DNA ligase [Bosea sp. NBC_00550]|uniref:ATP dependent DNA ligase n=1 Tax=Bosea sp. NBC_00550 TaxID=2969621 RepID=UPI0022324DE5|nr:ATP-dependent carboligase [Bosea sp. NBC_00550]UZF90424.1 ATP-dependent carboligase [Bosea sp. NBC_00550]